MEEQLSRDMLRQFIADGEEKKTLDLLLNLSASQNKGIQDSILLASNEYNKVLKAKLKGTITNEAASAEIAEINERLLSIIDDINLGGEKGETDEDNPPVNGTQNSRKVIWAIIALILIVGGGLGLRALFASSGNDAEKGAGTNWIGTWSVVPTERTNAQVNLPGKIIINGASAKNIIVTAYFKNKEGKEQPVTSEKNRLSNSGKTLRGLIQIGRTTLDYTFEQNGAGVFNGEIGPKGGDKISVKGNKK